MKKIIKVFCVSSRWTQKSDRTESLMHGRDQLSRDSGLEQQILLVSYLFFSRRGGYGSESICYRYMMRKNWLSTLPHRVLLFTPWITIHAIFSTEIFSYHKQTFFLVRDFHTNILLFCRDIFVSWIKHN